MSAPVGHLRAPAMPAKPVAGGSRARGAPYRVGVGGSPPLLPLRHVQAWLREVAAIAVPLAALLWLVAFLLSGANAVALVLVPLALLISALSSPEVLMLLLLVLVTVLVLCLVLATLAAVFHAPLLTVARFLGTSGNGREAHEDEPAALLPDMVLRRRYVAGELTYEEFRSGMVALLTERCTRGELALTDFEAALDRLLDPARHLDVVRDPTLAAAPRRRRASPG